MQAIRNKQTGYMIKTIGKAGTNTGRFYFTAMAWMSDSRHIIVCANIDEHHRSEYVRVDTVTGECVSIAKQMEWAGGVVSGDDQLYAIDGPSVFAWDLHTLRQRHVCTLPDGCRFHEPPSIANDNRTMGVYWHDGNQWIIGTVDAASGQICAVITPGFEEPLPKANHAMINPKNNKLLFFAHEGKTEQVPDRMWIADTTAGESINIYKHKKTPHGQNGEYIGHEMWGADGQLMHFVKYAPSPIKPTGVYTIGSQGEQYEHIQGDYAYWHAAPSPDGRWIVADTHEEQSKIVLIDRKSKSAEIVSIVSYWPDHPGHPHPAFSPDSRKITYTFADEDNRLRVGIVELQQP